MNIRLALILVTLLCLAWPMTARADGIIIPQPPICDPWPCPQPVPLEQLEIKYHHVTVSIDEQVALTHVDQVFYNPNDWAVEGTYIFPLPQDAAVTGFTLWIDGEPVQGEVLDAEQARQTYEEIVRNLRDPALLEYVGRGAVQASIFPIPPGGERRIELEYSQVLTAEGGLVRYTYPLNTEKFSLQPLESVKVSVNIRASQSIRAVYSTSHEIDVARDGDRQVTAGYEATSVLPDTDFTLFYSIGESQAFHLLSYRDPTDLVDADGFFLALLAPQPQVDEAVQAKDLVLVLDRSGSMEGEKFRQAQEALRYIIKHLNEDDRFSVIAFSTGLETYSVGLRPASEANEALSWVDRLSAQGSTDINRALLEAAAMADRERPTYLIFLTDGLPTEGEVESQRILDNFKESAPRNLRLFAFGVGYDVDTFLLDSLSQEHQGTSTYVAPGERLDEILSSFYAKISTPVLTDLSLDFGEMAVYDLYPQPLPDLFNGSQIIAVGRYKHGGAADVMLRGEVNGVPQELRFAGQVFAQDTRSETGPLAALPRLWATRKVGYLLNQVRLQGPDEEIINQIVKLSIRYGIVTPYTSYLVTEDMPLGQAAQEQIAGEQFDALQNMPAAPVSGEQAVQKAADQGAMSRAESAAAPPAEAADTVKVVGTRTFVFSGETWVDTAYDPQAMQPQPVSFLSEDYFRLAQSRPDLGAALALGPRVIVVADGIAYEVVITNEPSAPVTLPQAGEPTPASQPTPIGAQSLSTPAGEPAATQPVSQPVGETPRPAPGQALPCLGALIPLALWAFLGIFIRRRA